VPDVSLIAGLQYLHAERARNDKFNGPDPATRSGRKSYDFFNPKLGILWQLDSQWQVYGNVSRSAEPPTFGDMNFSTANDLDRLKAQRATTFEVGTRGKRGDFGWDVSVYHARVKNEFQCLSSQWSICDRTTNLDSTIHQGLEAGFNWTFLKGVFGPGDKADRMVLNLAYTFSDFHYRQDAAWGNNQLPGIPRHYLRAEVLYKHSAGFFIGPNIEWVPQAYYVDNMNSVKTTPYVLLGLRAGWERDKYSVFLEGRNLTDKRYIASISATDRAQQNSALYEPGTGRAVFAGVRIYY
jgi:iron complex outermembrane receptor protein